MKVIIVTDIREIIRSLRAGMTSTLLGYDPRKTKPLSR